jgi:hypothetical protein
MELTNFLFYTHYLIKLILMYQTKEGSAVDKNK